MQNCIFLPYKGGQSCTYIHEIYKPVRLSVRNLPAKQENYAYARVNSPKKGCDINRYSSLLQKDLFRLYLVSPRGDRDIPLRTMGAYKTSIRKHTRNTPQPKKACIHLVCLSMSHILRLDMYLKTKLTKLKENTVYYKK